MRPLNVASGAGRISVRGCWYSSPSYSMTPVSRAFRIASVYSVKRRRDSPISGAEPVELDAPEPPTEAEHGPAAGQVVEQREVLDDAHRVVPRQHRDHRAELHPRWSGRRPTPGTAARSASAGSRRSGARASRPSRTRRPRPGRPGRARGGTSRRRHLAVEVLEDEAQTGVHGNPLGDDERNLIPIRFRGNRSPGVPPRHLVGTGRRGAGRKSVPTVWAIGNSPTWVARSYGAPTMSATSRSPPHPRCSGGPRRPQPVLAERQHEAPHRRQDRAPHPRQPPTHLRRRGDRR